MLQMRLDYILAGVFIAICTMFDIKKKEIPVFVILFFGIVSIFFAVPTGKQDWYRILFSLVPGASMLALSLCTRESIGYGDGLVVLVLGMLLGFAECALAVFAGLLMSAVAALFLLVIRKVNGKSRLPYMPFLAAGLGVLVFV